MSEVTVKSSGKSVGDGGLPDLGGSSDESKSAYYPSDSCNTLTASSLPLPPTIINQTSLARLMSVNSIYDFCIFGPLQADSTIGNSEDSEVAWCVLPRNNARVIPDGTITVLGYGDLTRINIAAGDPGGQLDPHGASTLGHPVGGNVSSTAVDGLFCLRVCTNSNSQFLNTDFCRHDLDELGCAFTMPANYDFNSTFQSCDADAGYPPGWYPDVVGGTTSFSKLSQTIGVQITVQLPATTPTPSNCVTIASISNGIALSSLTAGAVASSLPSGFGSSSGSASNSGTESGTRAASGPSNSNTDQPPSSV
ncbi:hypothetical protein B0H19DRAFT_1206235 [Mycena capillaripes]|nr:hypothetical protein B0H19DRAFT_1206235 [Mycena capillaripes]